MCSRVGGVGFFYRVLFLRENIAEFVSLANVKSCLFCSGRIITGQPSDRKSNGMYIYLRSTIFISSSSPMNLQKLVELKSRRCSAAQAIRAVVS